MPQITHCQRSHSAPGLGSARSYISARLIPVLGSFERGQGLGIRGRGQIPPQASRRGYEGPGPDWGMRWRWRGTPQLHTFFLSRKVAHRQGLGKEEVLLGQTPCLATPWGGSLHGGEQWGRVVRDMVQVGTDIKAVNHVVGVPLPGHPEVGSREARCLGSLQPRTQSTFSLPSQAWEPGRQPAKPHAMPLPFSLHLSLPHAASLPE